MRRRDLFVLVEEASAAEIVEAIGDKLGLTDRMIVYKHQGINDLRKSVARKMNANTDPHAKYLVLCDADGADCKQRKADFAALIPQAKRRRSRVRVACQEIEAWYLAQPDALERAGSLKTALPHSISRQNTDGLNNPRELFLRHAHNRGQIAHAREIGIELDPENVRSASFRNFVAALRTIAAM